MSQLMSFSVNKYGTKESPYYIFGAVRPNFQEENVTLPFFDGKVTAFSETTYLHGIFFAVPTWVDSWLLFIRHLISLFFLKKEHSSILKGYLANRAK